MSNIVCGPTQDQPCVRQTWLENNYQFAKLEYKFRKLLTLRRGRSCAGPQIMSQPLNNMSNIVCGPTQDRPLRSADLAIK